MPGDNTTLPAGGGGDTIRTLDRTGTGAPKTEVMQLDVGGAEPSAESLVSQTNPLPVLVLNPEALPERQLDDDGIPYVNPNAPDADIATETLQKQQLNAILGPALNPAAPVSVAVGVSSVLVVAANRLRRGLVITNTSTSAQRIALALHGGAAVLDAGIVLSAGNWWWMDRYSFTTNAVYAIASAVSGAVAVQEFN